MKRLKFIVLILATVLPGLAQAEQVAPTEQAVLPEPSAAIDESAQFTLSNQIDASDSHSHYRRKLS